MQRRQVPVQVLVRVKEPLQQQARSTANRGRYGPGPSTRYDYRPRGGPGGEEFRVMSSGRGFLGPVPGPAPGPAGVPGRGGRGGRGGGRQTAHAPTVFVRNPKFPKSLYDVEIGMRQVLKDRPVKITPGMSFPDPKSNKSISNPTAPRFKYDFTPTRDDYNIIRNPVAGAEDTGEMGPVRERYIDAVRYCSDSDSDSDNPDGQVIKDDDSTSNASDLADEESDGEVKDALLLQLQARSETEKLYAHVKPMTAHRIREGQLLEAEPPVFEPQPPPPRAPIDPVLVIPRAMLREEELQRDLRNRASMIKNRPAVSTPDDDNNGME